jgi:hypothetical protein
VWKKELQKREKEIDAMPASKEKDDQKKQLDERKKQLKDLKGKVKAPGLRKGEIEKEVKQREQVVAAAMKERKDELEAKKQERAGNKGPKFT